MGAAKSLSRTLVSGLAAVCTALWCVAPTPVGATGGDFDYAVERVTIDGNLFGPHDGTPDIAEETFAQHLGPPPENTFGFVIPFGSLFGTVQDIDGALHLMSPGTPLDLPSLGLSLNQSDVLSRSPLLRDTAGDARVEVAFQAATLGVNHFVHATFAIGGVYAGLAFANYDEVVAQRMLGPAIPGFSMFSHLVSGGLEPIAGQSLSIDPASVGGAFVLALDYDDTAKTITPSYSLDGGQTFNGGFDPLPIPGFDGSGVGTGILIIGADPRVPLAGPPPPVCPYGIWRNTVAVARRQDGTGRLSFRGRGSFDSRSNVPVDPVSEGAQLTITDRGSLAALAQLTGSAAVPPGAPGSGCDPRDGWTVVGTNKFVYKNYSGAFPPACAAGSANGLTRMVVRRVTSPWDVDVAASVKMPTVPASVTGPVYSLLVRGQGGSSDGSGTCLALQTADVTCATRGSRVRCKY